MPTDLPTPRTAEERPPPAYVATAVGTCAGAGIAGALGYGLGALYVERSMPNAGLEAVIPIGIGMALGLWLGGVLGAWAALVHRSAAARKSTVLLLAAALPAWSAISIPLLLWMLQGLSRYDAPIVLDVVTATAVLCIPPSVAARALAIAREKREREETFR